MNRVAIVCLGLLGCAGAQHDIVVQPLGGYAPDVVVVAHDSLRRALPGSLRSTTTCRVDAQLDARDMGRAAASFDGIAPSRIRIQIDLHADCSEEERSSSVIHEVPAGPTASDRQAALVEGVQAACRMAAHRLRAVD